MISIDATGLGFSVLRRDRDVLAVAVTRSNERSWDSVLMRAGVSADPPRRGQYRIATTAICYHEHARRGDTW